MNKVLCGGFAIAVLMPLAFDAHADFDESEYLPGYMESCQYAHDVLKDDTPVNECAHVLAFYMSHFTDINNNAHAKKVQK